MDFKGHAVRDFCGFLIHAAAWKNSEDTKSDVLDYVECPVRQITSVSKIIDFYTTHQQSSRSSSIEVYHNSIESKLIPGH